MIEKLAVITGASKGIGLAIARAFAQNGFNLVINSRKKEDLEKVKKDLETQYKINCHFFSADISIKKNCLAFADFVQKIGTPVSVLINNAGAFAQGPIMAESEGDVEKLIETNLYSAYWLTYALMPSIRKAKNSHIFNICSIASLQAYPNSGAYTISKFALLGFSKSLRMELMPEKIKVTSIMPGATFTSSWDGADIPEERFMKASDVGETVWAAYNVSPTAVIEEILMRPIEGDI